MLYESIAHNSLINDKTLK